MVVWDRNDDPHETEEGVLLWRSYARTGNSTSVPQYLEKHAERLRSRYLAFIHDLGESLIENKRVVDHLDMGAGCSYWWMTNLAEKSPFKSPRLYDCLRLLALEEILLQNNVSCLTLCGGDKDLALAIRGLCQNLQLRFDWAKGGSTRFKRSFSVRLIYDALPFPIQGLLNLRHIFVRWPLRKLEKPEWFPGDNAIFLCSNFFNWDVKAAAEGSYRSRQWEDLPQHLQSDGKRLNWIHHFIGSPGMSDTQKGVDWLCQFNLDAGKQGYHAFLDSYLSWAVVLKVLRKWIWLCWVSWRLRDIRLAFSPKESKTSLWPLLKNDWKTSLCGPIAIRNCLWLELFDDALRDMPYQKIGLYLWENHAWERALIRAWRRNGHGIIIGVPHSTIAFWHLNNFEDPRSLRARGNCMKPLPDLLAVNGPMAFRAFVQAGYPADRLVRVEAQRFQYILDNRLGLCGRKGVHPAAASCLEEKGYKRFLILGDFTQSQTMRMLRCVEKALPLAGLAEMEITVKYHPLCNINRMDCPAFSFETTDEPLGEIMPNFDLAFVGNSTSAGLDALLAGLAVAVFLDGGDFNHSPLREVEGVCFVSSSIELAAFLRSACRNESPPEAGDFFWLGHGFDKWDRVLLDAGVRNDRKP